MLLTVTSNPTIDRTLHVPTMEIGQVHRAVSVHLAAGGKGLNVSRATRTLGAEVLATGPLAGHTGQAIADLATAEGLAAAWHWLDHGETRNCILINHDNQDATVINEQGPTLSEKDWDGYAMHVTQLAQSAQAVAFSGSVPLGVAPEALGRLACSLATRDRPIYVDTSAAALASLLKEPAGVSIKINQMELIAGMGLALNAPSIDDLIEIGRQLLKRDAALVVVTLGGAGAVAISTEGIWQVTPPSIEVVSTVGSGDSMLAGLAIARLRGQPVPDALAFGVACGTANVLSGLPGRFEQSQVEDVLGRVRITHLG